MTVLNRFDIKNVAQCWTSIDYNFSFNGFNVKVVQCHNGSRLQFFLVDLI